MVRYSANAKAYRVYNESTGIVEETYDVEFDELNERYGGINGVEDKEEQRRDMEKMPKGEIKPKDNGDEVVDLNGSSSTQEEYENKPLTPHDGQGKEPLSQTQAQDQESSPQDQVSPSRKRNQTQANTSRSRTRQQTSIEAPAQETTNREWQSSRAGRGTGGQSVEIVRGRCSTPPN